jgi:hypothetical protein
MKENKNFPVWQGRSQDVSADGMAKALLMMKNKFLKNKSR